MSFNKLPVEIFTRILEQVGSEELRSGRLQCVSTAWYAAAQPIIYREVHLSGVSICHVPLLSKRTVGLIQDNVRDLTIDLDVRRDWCQDISQKNFSAPEVYEAIEQYLVTLNESLTVFIKALSRCRHLKHLVVRTVNGMIINPDQLSLEFSEYGPIWRALSHSSFEALTSLTIVTRFFRFGRRSDPQFHLCELIAPQLPRLHRLWIQLEMICPDLFAAWSNPANLTTNRLERLVINLMLPLHHGTHGRNNDNVERCIEYIDKHGWPPEIDDPGTYGVVLGQIEKLFIASREHWKVLRLILHDHGENRTRAVDFVPTLKSSYLSDGSDWEELGEPLVEDEGISFEGCGCESTFHRIREGRRGLTFS